MAASARAIFSSANSLAFSNTLAQTHGSAPTWVTSRAEARAELRVFPQSESCGGRDGAGDAIPLQGRTLYPEQSNLVNIATRRASAYLRRGSGWRVKVLDGPLPEAASDPAVVLASLDGAGSPATVANAGSF